MARTSFDDLPADARIWIFSTDRPLEPEERDRIDGAVEGFLEAWNAHGTPLRGAREWRYDRFLLVGVDQAAAPPSGCSIDALVRVFKDLERDLGVALLDRSPIWYRVDDQIRCVSRLEFRELAEAGEVGPETVVFNGALTRMEDLREGEWEVPARESWHNQLL
ncbi:MAG: ABC transporter ATPase [Longimicrobiales bacterium]